MYKGKHTANTPARKAKVGKTAVIAVAIVLAVALAVGGTVAYLTTHTQELTNIFSPSEVMAKVEEGSSGVYTIRNDGDVAAYLRVAVVANWVDTDFLDNLSPNPSVYWKQPDFTVTAENSSAEGEWVLGSDGFYYYSIPVTADTAIPDKITVKNNESAPNGYKFSVQVLAEAIQSEPITAVTRQDTWGVTVDGNRIVRK